MNNNSDFFMQMCKEATEELASGKVGWRDADTNTLFLACFGMLCNHVSSRIVKPLWFFACAVGTGVIGYLVTRVLGG